MTDTIAQEPMGGSVPEEPQPATPYQLTIKRGFLAFAIMLGSQILVGFIMAFVPSVLAALNGEKPEINIVSITIFSVLISGFVLWWWVRNDMRRFGPSFAPQIGLKPSSMSVRDIVILSVVTFAAVRFLSMAYMGVVSELGGDADSVGAAEQIFAAARENGSVFDKYGMLFTVIFVAPFLEELVFRGYLQSSLLHKMPIWAAIFISSGVFATVHGNLVLWPIYFMLGASMGWVFYKSGSLKAAIGFHLVNNLIFSIVAVMGWTI